MQFNVVAIIATLASVAAAASTSTVTVTVCSTGTGSHGTAVASTGVKVPPTPTGSPIAQFTGAASVNGVSGSALGMIIAGGVALSKLI